MAVHSENAYPVTFNVDYPEGPRKRLTALFRLILAIPILVVVSLISGYSTSGDPDLDRTTLSSVRRRRIMACHTRDALVQEEVSSLVVRLEPGVAEIQRKGGRVLVPFA